MIYLLDTNAWIAYLRQNDPPLIARFQQIDPIDLRLCSVVLAELTYGAHRSPPANRDHNLSLLQQLSARFPSLPFDDLVRADSGRLGCEGFADRSE